MRIRIKFLKLNAGRPVAILHRDTAERLSVHVDDRIKISKDRKDIIAVVDVATGMIKKDEIAVSKEVASFVNAKEGEHVEIGITPKPLSNKYILKKLKGERLNREEIKEIIKDIADNALTEPEIAYFIAAIQNHGMSFDESLYLIKEIAESGNKLNLKKKIVVDKHSIGGGANRTTPIVVSICASAGLIMPKTSSRAITSAAGTADVMESFCKVDFSIEELYKIIRKTNACMVWGGSLNLAPADDKIIKIERLLNVDSPPQLIASILAKKLAVGSKYVVIDIPYGKNAKVTKKEGKKLAKNFKRLGKKIGLEIECLLTDGSQPIGNGIGPYLEAKDVLSVLKGNGPNDLKEKSLFIAGKLLELCGKARKNEGKDIARKILESGRALKKFRQIVSAQKGRIKNLPEARFKRVIKAEQDLRIKEISNRDLNIIARIAGCPADKAAGVFLHKHVGDIVKGGEVIITLFSESAERLGEAVSYYYKTEPIR